MATKRIKKAWLGLHPYRFSENPLERKFALAWQDSNDRLNSTTNLDYMLHTGDQGGAAFIPQASERDRTVACTVIQWLGSPVGQGFLRDLRDPESREEQLEAELAEARSALRAAGDIYPSLRWLVPGESPS